MPLIIGSGMLHWLLGRSIYIVKVDVYGFLGDRQPDNDFFACGYTPETILGLLVLLGSMLLALALFSFRKLGPGSPIVELNSLAIAAACHRDSSEDEKMVTMPVMWGVIRDERGAETGHCNFSSREVAPVTEGINVSLEYRVP